MFFSNLESFGNKVALVLEDGVRVTYQELASRADAHARKLADRRCLLAIEMLNDVMVEAGDPQQFCTLAAVESRLALAMS